MHTHQARITWQRAGAPFLDGTYSRVHRWRFDGGAEVLASASTQRVPVPLSSEEAVDPEEALVAAVSSCHLLWFLFFAAQEGVLVDDYVDEAEGRLTLDPAGHRWLSEFVLRPRVAWAAEAPSREVQSALHHRAHEACFVARSLKGTVRIEPR